MKPGGWEDDDDDLPEVIVHSLCQMDSDTRVNCLWKYHLRHTTESCLVRSCSVIVKGICDI